jgi:hypothetical protein
MEFLPSFVLMFVIMAVATDERVADGFAGSAAGLTVGSNAIMGGPLTWASMNPAPSLGPALAGSIWEVHWIYWVAPIAAMVLAARTYDFLRVVRVPQIVPPGIPLGVQGPLGESNAASTYGAQHPLEAERWAAGPRDAWGRCAPWPVPVEPPQNRSAPRRTDPPHLREQVRAVAG